MREVTYRLEPVENGYIVEMNGFVDDGYHSVKHVFLDRESMYEFILSNL